MPSKAVAFSDFTPDLAPANSAHLSIAQNVRPIANGFASVPSFLSVSIPLPDTFLGGASFIGSDGNSTLLVGQPSQLVKLSGNSWATAVGLATNPNRWYFTQYGDNALGASGVQIASVDLISGAAHWIDDAPDNAIDVATVKDVVMCLTADSTVAWCDINNSEDWTGGQADTQPLLDGGTGVRIIGGEYGIILQKSSIRRATYTGVDQLWFQFDVISPEIGCMAAGSVCNVGRLIFFLSERGFEMCDGETVTSIGGERVNNWFFDQFSRDDIKNIWCAADPRRSEILWVMPGSPGVSLLYNYELQKWSQLSLNALGVFGARTPATSIDGLDATFGNLDAIPLSLDDPSFAGGNPFLLLVDSANTVGTLSGANLQADFRLQNIELTPGRRSRIRTLRPITDAVNASAKLNVKMRAGDAESYVTTSAMRPNGKMPIRANGRYVDLSLTIPAGTAWSYVQGCEYEFEAGDAR